MDDPKGLAREITITIDGLTYRCRASVVTATGVRRIPHPPIEGERDLWLEVPDGSDRFLADDEEVVLKEGLRFFTAPRSILAGASYHGVESVGSGHHDQSKKEN
jgi:hypothetical protein